MGQTKTHLLVFPPFVEQGLNGPHLAPSLLTAFLNRAGVPALSVDLNIRIISTMLSPRWTAALVAAAVDHVPRTISPQEHAVLQWLVTEVQHGTHFDHPATLRLALRTIRASLFPLGRTLEELIVQSARRLSIVDELYDHLLADVFTSDVGHVGVSVAFAEQLGEALYVAQWIRRRFPSKCIVLGGSQISLLQETQLDLISRAGVFDTIVHPNGELSIGDVFRTLDAPGKTSSIVRTGPLKRSDLIGYPQPVFSNCENYFKPLTLPLLVTKGCFWGRCAFCDYRQLNDLGGQRFLARPVGEAFDELVALRESKHADVVALISDAVPPAWYSRLAQLAIDRGVSLSTWSYMLHSPMLSFRYFELLHRAGVSAVTFGTESTNDRLLALMGKPTTFKVIAENIRGAHEAGIRVTCNIIPNYPTTTFSEALQIAADCSVLSENIDDLNAQMFDLTAGTELAKSADGQSLVGSRDAYHRSSHGFHTMTRASDKELDGEKVLILKRLYDTLSHDIALKRRRRQIGTISLDADVEATLDSGMCVSDRNPEVLIPALGCRLTLSDREHSVLAGLFRARNYRVSGCRLSELYPGNTGDLLRGWIDRGMITNLAHSGSCPPGVNVQHSQRTESSGVGS